MHKGACLCGVVSFEVTCDLPTPDADPVERDSIAVAMGGFEAPTGTRLGVHIYVAEKGDYYDIADGLPQNQR
jgi:hypothetical protein